jgi:hypothetical protein
MAHEKSISVGSPPNVFLVPSAIDGQEIPLEVVIQLFESGQLEAIDGPFPTIELADQASIARSNAYKNKNDNIANLLRGR